MEKLKKIDIHVHCDMWGGREMATCYGTKGATPAQIRDMYDRHGIDKGILLPECSPEDSFSMQTNELCEYTVSKNPETFYWFANIDPRLGFNGPRNNMSYIINHYKDMGARGIGEICASLPFDDPLCDNLFFHAGECGMPVTIHMSPGRYNYYGLIDSYGLPKLERALRKFPKLKIFGHSAMFWSHISADLPEAEINGYPKGKVKEGRIAELLRRYDGLYGDMSAGSGFNAMARDPEYAYKFIEEFQDKLMFGTDACSPGDGMELSEWLDEALACGGISETAYYKVCRGNAIRLLGLPEDK